MRKDTAYKLAGLLFVVMTFTAMFLGPFIYARGFRIEFWPICFLAACFAGCVALARKAFY